jgi:hypothetical protein
MGRSIGCISTSFRLYTFRAFGFVLTVPVLFTLSNSASDTEDDAPYVRLALLDDGRVKQEGERDARTSSGILLSVHR